VGTVGTCTTGTSSGRGRVETCAVIVKNFLLHSSWRSLAGVGAPPMWPRRPCLRRGRDTAAEAPSRSAAAGAPNHRLVTGRLEKTGGCKGGCLRLGRMCSGHRRRTAATAGDLHRPTTCITAAGSGVTRCGGGGGGSGGSLGRRHRLCSRRSIHGGNLRATAAATALRRCHGAVLRRVAVIAAVPPPPPRPPPQWASWSRHLPEVPPSAAARRYMDAMAPRRSAAALDWLPQYTLRRGIQQGVGQKLHFGPCGPGVFKRVFPKRLRAYYLG